MSRNHTYAIQACDVCGYRRQVKPHSPTTCSGCLRMSRVQPNPNDALSGGKWVGGLVKKWRPLCGACGCLLAYEGEDCPQCRSLADEPCCDVRMCAECLAWAERDAARASWAAA